MSGSRMLSMALRDGRTLAWREYGRELGPGVCPVVFAHGNLNSRMFAPTWAKSGGDAADCGARVIAVDRPGYGGSSAHNGRTYKDFAQDIDELTRHLGLERYTIAGFSSGGPHALACAAENIGGRVVSCALISSDAPYASFPDGGLVEKMFGVPGEEVDMAWALRRAKENAEAMRQSYQGMAKEDRRLLALEDIDTATANGLDGAASDSVLESHEWGFDWKGVSVPVYLWHGDKDEDVPVWAGQYLAEALGLTGDHATRAKFIEGESHTLIRRHWRPILETLVSTHAQSRM